jgi:hypothetical protein
MRYAKAEKTETSTVAADLTAAVMLERLVSAMAAFMSADSAVAEEQAALTQQAA